MPLSSELRPQFLKEDLGIDLFPFQSPLLWESLLVSFPPLSNMFKFSGSPYLRSARGERRCTTWCSRSHIFCTSRLLPTDRINAKIWHVALTFLLEDTYSVRCVTSIIQSKYDWWVVNQTDPGILPAHGPGVPFAFKNLMIRIILQFTLRIAFRCVLHRRENQEIHRTEDNGIGFMSRPNGLSYVDQ